MSEVTVLVLLNKITNLATKRQQPLNILQNPRYESYLVSREGNCPDSLVATIGNISVSFDGYSINDLIELYAGLKSGLESEEARIDASQKTWELARRRGHAESSK